MRLEVIDCVSAAGRSVNDDRLGSSGPLAWVIDGATDLIEQRLLPGPSDAAWLADEVDRALMSEGRSHAGPGGLPGLLARVTATVEAAFDQAKLRDPAGQHEHPSAAGMVIALAGGRIEYLSLADCVLLIERADGLFTRIGIDEHLAGDGAAIRSIEETRLREGHASWKEARKARLKTLQRGRARLNVPGGYGALSITLPPAAFVTTGHLSAAPGTHVLIASDGFTRLSDVFGCYPFAGLISAARQRGLPALLAELRALESADADGSAFPRFKRHDDASALLARVVA